MQGNDLWATAFRDTVEGKPGLCSVELTSDTGLLDFGKPRQEATKPRPELIVELLRSKIELTTALRNIVADMLDPSAESAFCYKTFGRRKPGRHPPWERWNMEVALFVEEKFVEKGLFESAVSAAMEEFNMARSTVTKAYSLLLEARQIEQRNQK